MRLWLGVFFAALCIGVADRAPGQSGTWSSVAGGNWSNIGNWSGGAVANGAGHTADFSTLNPTADVTVQLDTARTIGNLIFGDTDNSSGANWILGNNGSAANILTLAGTGPTITANTLNANNAAIINTVIAGSNGLTKTGTSFVVLTAANTYSGGTVLSGGDCRISVANNQALGTGTVTVGANSGDGEVWFQSAGNNTLANNFEIRTIRWIIAAQNAASYAPGNLTVNGNVYLNRSSGDIFCEENLTLNGNITGEGGFTELGGNTVTMAGANSYTGGTTITSGNLVVNGSVTDTGAVTVSGGTELTGTGAVGGTVTVQSGGTLAPGHNGAGTFTAGGLVLDGGSALNVVLTTPGAASGSSLQVNGNLTLGGTINITNLAGFSSSLSYTSIWYSGTLVNNGLTPGLVPAGTLLTVDTSTPHYVVLRFTSTVVPPYDTMSDTWAAIDDLGRNISENATVGPPQANRTVAMFYYAWAGYYNSLDNNGNFLNTSATMATNAAIAATPWDSSLWDAIGCPVNSSYYWAEPLFGYYNFAVPDEWVIRKHCQMLADAGVDVIVFDVTNGAFYDALWMKLFSVYSNIRAAGGKTPQFAFFTHNNSAATIGTLYTNYYSAGQYSNLWFYWDGKPLILGDPTGLPANIVNFFTTRQCWAFPSGSQDGWWWWLDSTPQHAGLDPNGVLEEMCIAPQNGALNNVRGRSWTTTAGEPAWPGPYPNSGEGLFLAQQWAAAQQTDPPLLFVTQWNEWFSGRSTNGAGLNFLGHTLAATDSFWVDEFIPEFSRDLEPMSGGFNDDYYWQFVDTVRQFKGARAVASGSAPVTVNLNDFTVWPGVGPQYLDDTGDIFHRNNVSAGNVLTYVNNTGRNDFQMLKVARDTNNFYFFAQTVSNITVQAGTNWMNLFIGVETNNPSPSWQKFQYWVAPQSNAAGAPIMVYSYTGNGSNWSWTASGPTVAMVVSGNQMALAVPRTALGLTAGQTEANIRFKWADNMQTGSPLDWLQNGDTAPNARFAYRYVAPETAQLPPAGPPSRLAVTQQPSATAAAGTAFATPPQVTVLDTNGNIVTGYATAITASETSGGNLNGTVANSVTGTLANGVATFPGLYVTNPGTATLKFSSSGLPSTNSATISVSAGAVSQLLWSAQPGNATNAQPLGTPPVLKTVDQYGNPSVNGLAANLYVTVSPDPTVGPLVAATGKLTYNLGTAGGIGVVTCTNLQINGAGPGNQLLAWVNPGGVLPPDITSGALQVWLDAADTNYLAFNGGNVSAWKDKSGHGLSASQNVSANQPGYHSESSLLPGGGNPGNVLGFNGGSQILSNLNLSSLANTPYSIFTVVGRTAGGQNFYLGNNADGTTDHAFIMGYNDSSDYLWVHYNDNAGVYPIAAYGGEAFTVYGDTMTSSSSHTVYQNGVSLGATAVNELSGASAYLTNGTVGGWNDTATEHLFTGDLAEVIVYTGTLASGDVASVDNYLLGKWTTTPTVASAVSAPFTVQASGPSRQKIIGTVVNGGGSVALTYATTAGFQYQVQFRSNLVLGAWTILPGSATNATGTMVTFTDTNSPGVTQRFYRIVSP